jgi:NADPH-dependent curcumin reductase CurA
MQNKEIRLASRPAGMPTVDNFKIVDAEVPQPKDGEVLVRTLYISVDYYSSLMTLHSALFDSSLQQPGQPVHYIKR